MHNTSEEERRSLFAQNFADAYYAQKLDCGHKPSAPTHLHPHGMPLSTGYGTDPETGETFCYECATEKEKARIRETGEVFAYLSGDGKSVVNWPGGVLSNRVCVLNECRDNFGGERTYLRFEFEGDIYSGFAMGRGVYLRAKRTKLKSLWA